MVGTNHNYNIMVGTISYITDKADPIPGDVRSVQVQQGAHGDKQQESLQRGIQQQTNNKKACKIQHFSINAKQRFCSRVLKRRSL